MRSEVASIGSSANDAIARGFVALAGPILEVLERHPVALVVSQVRPPDNPVVFVNDAFCRLTGYTPNEVVGSSRSALYDAPKEPDDAASLATILDKRELRRTVLQQRKKDGGILRSVVSVIPVSLGSEPFDFSLITLAEPSGSADAVLAASQVQIDELRARLRVILSLAGAAAAWDWDIANNRIVGDHRFAALYGIKPEEAAAGVSSALFFSIIHGDDQPRVRLGVGGILRGAEVFSKEFRVVLPDHSVRWVHARGRCQYDSADRPCRFTGVLLDINDRKLAEERLRVAQSAGGIGTFEYIKGFATVTVSEEFCKLLGVQATNELPVHTINSVVHAEDAPIVDVSDRGEFPGEVRSELRILRPDTGELRWLARRGEFVRDAETAGVRFSGVIYDVTHSKQIEENLRTLNETLESRVKERTRERDGIWQLSKDLLGIADGRGVWLSVNPAWTRVLGWQPDEILGRTSQWLQHPSDKERAPFDPQADSMLEFQSRLRTSTNDYRWLAWTAVPQAGLFYCVARDITDQLRREETLARAEEQLRQSHKMEAVGQLTGGIAHDFNNMLTGVIASLGLIRRRLAAGRTDNLDEFIEAGMNSATRAAGLTHSLLAFARRQSLDVKSQDINGLVNGIQGILRRPLGENIALEFALAEDLWAASTDANQLENALLNLVLNARDAMPIGGTITIRTSSRRLESALPAHDGEISAGEYVVVSVTDTGTGMPQDVIAKAFEPFFTTKAIGQGTGLGLSMIYGFVKQSGGHVSIESELNRGTTVNVYLRRAPDVEESATSDESLPVKTGRGEVVLIVEDDSSVRFTMIELLKELGYRYLQAADAAAAIPYLQSKQRIDLLITDVGLPNMNGRQLAEVARQHRPELKVLFVTGYAEKAADRGGFLGRDMQMLSKPFSVEILAAKIQDLLEV